MVLTKNYFIKSITISLALVAITLPVSGITNSISIAILLIIAITSHYILDKEKTLLEKLKSVNVLIVYFYLLVIGIFYSSNIDLALKVLEHNLAFLIVPISFSLLSIKITKSLRDKILLSYAFAVISFLLFTHISIFLHIINNNESILLIFTKYLRNDFINFSIVDIHAPYFGMYSVFAFIIIFFSERIKVPIKTVLISYLLFSIYSISGFMSVAISIILILFFLINYLRNLKKRYISIVIVSLIVLISSLFIVLKQENTNSSNVVMRVEKLRERGGDSDRMENWESVFKLSKHDLLYGVGTGNELEEIQKVRNKIGWAWAYNHKANMHNQYLEILLRNGIIGLLLFIAILVYFVTIAYKNKDYVFSTFIFIISLSFISESILERQWGIVFFVFFSSLFISFNKTITNKKKIG